MALRRFVPLLALVAACGGGAGTAGSSPSTSAAPSGSPEGVVEQFMRAVADSNLTRIATLWGTTRGSAAETRQPTDYERRIVIMQAYLRESSYRVLPSENPDPAAQRRVVQVELDRKECTRVVPFTTVRAPRGWLVSAVDLAAAGTPGRACAPPPGDSLIAPKP